MGAQFTRKVLLQSIEIEEIADRFQAQQILEIHSFALKANRETC